MNPGLVIHHFPMPIQVGILGNQVWLFWQVSYKTQDVTVRPGTAGALWSHYAQEEVLLHHAELQPSATDSVSCGFLQGTS